MAKTKLRKKNGKLTKAGVKKKLSTAAKRRPRHKSGPKKGQFK